VRDEEEFATGSEELGEIAEGFGEEFTAASLRAQEVRQGEPAGA
jgi:hypothetical protein